MQLKLRMQRWQHLSGTMSGNLREAGKVSPIFANITDHSICEDKWKYWLGCNTGVGAGVGAGAGAGVGAGVGVGVVAIPYVSVVFPLKIYKKHLLDKYLEYE